MLKRPRSSLPTTRRMRASRFSARSSGGMSRVPMAAWNVRLSRLRTRTVFRNELMKFVGSAVGGTGRGILPRGPRTTPRRFPITGMRGASAMKKSYDVARALAFRLTLAYSYLLRLDHEVRDVPRLERKLTGSEDADADRLPPSFRQDDVFFDAILRDRKIDIAQVHGDLDGFFERAGLGGLEQLLDCLDRMLVRQGRSPPAVRAAVGPPAEERRRKSVPLIRLCGHTAAARFTGERTGRDGFGAASVALEIPLSTRRRELSVGR